MVSFTSALLVFVLALFLASFSEAAENYQRYNERFNNNNKNKPHFNNNDRQRTQPTPRPSIFSPLTNLFSWGKSPASRHNVNQNNRPNNQQAQDRKGYYSPSNAYNREGSIGGSSAASNIFQETANPQNRDSSNGGDYSKDGGKPLSSLVGPLAALAFIGSAAAISTSPILLTLAVLSSGRKRRDLEDERVENPLTEEMKEKLQEMEILEKYLANIPDKGKQQEKLMATYLSCSGYLDSDNVCMERIVCDYSVQDNKMDSLQKDVISIILYNIMTNGYVAEEFKERLRVSAQYGRSKGQCRPFACNLLNI